MKYLNNKYIFWFALFIFYSLVTILIFNHRIDSIFTNYAMPDVDTDGGLWYQWYLIYTSQNNNLYYINQFFSSPFGFDITFVPLYNLIYSVQAFLLQHIIGFSWSNLIFITNVSSLITYPLSALGASLLTYYITRNKWASILAGLIFGFSFYHVHMGRGQMSINHIEFIPFYILSLVYFLDKKNIASLLLSTFAFALLFNVDAYYAFFSGIFSVVIILFYKKETFLQRLKTLFSYYPLLLLILVLLNLNFFISNFYLFSQPQAAATGRNSIAINELMSILYYFVPQDLSLLRTYIAPLSYLTYALVPAIAFTGLLFLKRNRMFVTFLLCFLAGVMLSTYIPYFYWLNELYFRYFGMFRSVARIILPTYLFLGLMVGIAFAAFTKTKTFEKLNKKIIVVGYIGVLVLILLNSLNVDRTWYRESDFSKDVALYEPIKNNKNIKVLATYPMTQGDSIAGCPETYQIKAQIIHNKAYACGASPFDPYAIKHYKAISDLNNPGTIDYLIKYRIDTIIISNKLIDNAKEVNTRLKNDSRVAFVGQYSQSPDEGYASTTDLSRDISVYQLKPVLESNKSPKQLFYSTNKNQTVTYEKITPYKYIVKMENIKEKSELVFDYPYSDKWKLYLGDYTETKDLMFFAEEDNLYNHHTRYKEYMNGWQINPREINNSNNNNVIVATIYFEPQKIIFLGDLISKTTLLIMTLLFVGAIAYGRRKK